MKYARQEHRAFRGKTKLEHTKHIFRAVILLVLAVIGFVVFRQIAKPASFGDEGFFRADNLEEQMAKPLIHGSLESCTSCMNEEKAAKEVKANAHKSVHCETCHAPLSTHVKDGKKFAAMNKKKTASLCVQCHTQLLARPAKFPQVNVAAHLKSFDVDMPNNVPKSDVCFDCHEAHDPSAE